MTSSSYRVRNLRRSWVAACVILAALGLAGCSGATIPGTSSSRQATPPPGEPAPVESPLPISPIAPGEAPTPLAPGEKVSVAVLLPLSGPTAALGNGMLDAAQMALFDMANEHLNLVPRDTGGTAEGAAAAARETIDQGARLIIGPLTAAEVEAVKPIAQARGIPVLAFSTAADLAGNGTYLMGFLPHQEVARVVAFARQQGAQRFAALAPDSAYGHLTAEALKSAVDAQKATIAQTIFFDPTSSDLTPAVRTLASYDSRKAALDQQRRQLARAHDPASQEALKRLNDEALADGPEFDALLLPEGGQQLKTVAPLLPYYGLDPARVHFLGTGLWDDPALLTEPELQGGWYAAPAPAGRADFEKRYAELYGHRPPRLSTLAYDATALAAALARGERGPDFSAAALANPSGYLGLDGIFRLRSDGLVERGLAVIEIHRTGVTVVSPAPQTFENLGF